MKWRSEVTQSCLTLCNPMDCSLPGSSVHGTFQAKILEWVAIFFSTSWKWEMKVKSLSCVRLFATPWTVAYQDPLSMGFPRQEYWSGLPLPSPLRHIDIFIKTLRICFLRCFKIDSQIRTFGLLIVVPKLCDEVESNRERNTNKLPYAKRKKIPQSMQALDSAFASS